MTPFKTPLFYSTCLVVFVVLSIKELTSVKKPTRFESWNNCVWDVLDSGKWDKRSRTLEFWNKSSDILSTCKMILDLKPTKLPNSKLHLFSGNATDERIHVSFGIENNTHAMAELQKLAPNTVFYSTGISNSPGTSPGHIGTVISLEIGQEAGLVEKMTEYHNGTLVKVGMTYFLRQILKRDFYDSMWFNQRTSDFSIWRAVLKGGEFDRNSVTVCQINFKLDSSAENNVDFHNFVINVISDRKYMMFLETVGSSQFVFLVNFSSLKCRETMKLDP